MASDKQDEARSITRRGWLRAGGLFLLGLGGAGIKTKAVIQGHAESYGLPELADPKKDYSDLQGSEALLGAGAAMAAAGCPSASRRELLHAAGYATGTYILADTVGQGLGNRILQTRAENKKRHPKTVQKETQSIQRAPDWDSRVEARDRLDREDRER